MACELCNEHMDNIVKQAAVIEKLQIERQKLFAVIYRGGMDVSACKICGEAIACLPDGLPMCVECAEMEDKSNG
jgi:hypothetical protein